jgi:membrane protease YdiL (CAAX protease family)
VSETAEVTAGTAIVGFIVLGAYLTSFVLWSQSVSRYGRALFSQLVPLRPQSQPFWTPVHFLMTFGFFIVSVSLMLGLTVGQPEMQSLAVTLTLNTLGGLGAVIGSILLFSAKVPDAAERLGLTLRFEDVRLGFIAALMILPPVMIISGLVSNLVEYHHPVLDSLKATPGLRLFLVMVVGTAIITPFVEEFLFRVLLQGGLQGLADHVSRNKISAPAEPIVDPSFEPQPATDLGSRADLGLNPYAVGSRVMDDSAEARPAESRSASLLQANSSKAFQPKAWWPIVVASTFFAAMHLGQGAAPIPLFFLSAGLGYLYRQTGTITASFVVHAVLNFITLAANFAELPS